MSAQAEINAHMSGLIARSAEIAALRREEDIDEAVRCAMPLCLAMWQRIERTSDAPVKDKRILTAARQHYVDIQAEYRRIVTAR